VSSRSSGQPRFSNLAIEATLILGAVKQLDLVVPDHMTLARRRRTVDVQPQRLLH
jgi:hypothetical protein